jgi:hypothetical protein
MLLFENTYVFRKRVIAIGLFYVVYFAMSIAALVRIAQNDYTFGLVVPITTASLHFVFALVGMIANDRTAMKTNVAKLVQVFDWGQMYALGIASSSISRDNLDQVCNGSPLPSPSTRPAPFQAADACWLDHAGGGVGRRRQRDPVVRAANLCAQDLRPAERRTLRPE